MEEHECMASSQYVYTTTKDLGCLENFDADDFFEKHSSRLVLDVEDIELSVSEQDMRYLMTLCEMFSGGPVGAGTLSAALSEARDALEDVIEPYLIQQGFLQRTPQGRVATARAYAHLGLAAPITPAMPSLFDEESTG